MIHYQMKQIRSCHFEDVSMQVLAAESSLRLGECRFEQAKISQPIAPPIVCNLARVDLNHIIKFQELHTVYSASFRKAFECFAFTFALAARTFDFALAGAAGAIRIDCPSVVNSISDSGLIFSKSRIGRSITIAQLLPCFTRFLIMISLHRKGLPMVSQWSTICKADLVDAGLRDHIQGRSCTRSNEKTPARCNRGAIGSLHVVSDCTLVTDGCHGNSRRKI